MNKCISKYNIYLINIYVKYCISTIRNLLKIVDLIDKMLLKVFLKSSFKNVKVWKMYNS